MRHDEAFKLEVGDGKNDNAYEEQLHDMPIGTMMMGPEEPLLCSEFGSHLRVTDCFFAHSYNAAMDAQQAFVLELANTQSKPPVFHKLASKMEARPLVFR